MSRFLSVTVVVCVLFMPTMLAQNYVYTAGDKIWQRDLNGANPLVVCNASGTDVAVDRLRGKIFWAVNSNVNTGTIMMANLIGCGSQIPLLTTTKIDELQIDVGTNTIYWSSSFNNRIYRSSISSPSVSVLPLNPSTLRGIALDLRPSKLHLYYVDDFYVYRANLDGSNATQLPNPIVSGLVVGGIAIDTCNDYIIATVGLATNTPAIIRADLSDADNAAPILQDLIWPPLTVGANPSKIMLDFNGGMMYWTVALDQPGGTISTVRRANLNGTGPTVIAQGNHIGNIPFASGMALEVANTTCTTVGVNKDLKNNTGKVANNIEILLAGSYVNVNHYDGYPANVFSSFTESPAPGGNTLLAWSNPNNDVQPGQVAHVGFNVPGSSVNILSVSWTHNATIIGCVSQVSTNTHFWGSSGSQVIYANNCLGCKSVTRYVGALKIEWYARHVPLAELNARTRRKPIRTDVIRRAPILLAPEAIARVNVPEAPPNALFGVVIHKVSTNPELSGPDVTTDFLEFPVKRNRPRVSPATQRQRTN